MNIQEVANTYAESKANEAITKAIAQAYIDGFNDGYKSWKVNVQIECNDTEFVDLGLPSGTLWASDYVKDSEGEVCYLPYIEARKYSIPSIEQWEELSNTCKWEIDSDNRITCIGLNGNVISFNQTGYIKIINLIDGKRARMWMIDDEVVNEKNTIIMYVQNGINIPIKKYVCKSFSGFKLPVRLVR